MQYFTIQAESHREATEKMRKQYGEGSRILTYKSVRLGGFLGLFSRDGIEVTGYVSADNQRKRNVELNVEKKKIIETAKREQTLDLLLKEVQSLRKSLRDHDTTNEEHPSVTRMKQLLRSNAFSEEYIDGLVERMRRDLSLEHLGNFNALQQKVLEWIGEGIEVCRPIRPLCDEPSIFVLVGPTGVGKTTTIAKIAAIHGIDTAESQTRKVRIITIDNYRIAAREQIKTY